MNLGLRGRGVVVTGGSRGIGRAIALTCAGEGANVAICARGQNDLDETLADLRAHHVQAFGQVADVTQSDAMKHFVAASAEVLGRIDILVSNVGGSKGKGLLSSSDEEWIATFDLNLFHAVRAARAVVPYMSQQGEGSIVIISSISGYKPSLSLQYSATKAGADSMAGRKRRRHETTPAILLRMRSRKSDQLPVASIRVDEPREEASEAIGVRKNLSVCCSK
jgi:3-oxoacyl-[acyl-carrier protein] reductase